MLSEEKNKNMQELEFAIFCIENIAEKLKKRADQIYAALAEKSNILNDYIVPEYEMLHTQGKEYIVNDIIGVMKERGAENLSGVARKELFPVMNLMRMHNFKIFTF